MGNELHTCNFIDRIKSLRQKKNWTQQNLADSLGVDLKTVRNWENKKTDPPACNGMKLSHFISLCELLGCDPEYLISDLPTRRKVNANIMEETGISERAADTLQNLTENEKLFLNKLLEDRESLYFIASGYADFSRHRTISAAIDKGWIEEDFGLDTLENQNKLDFSRFTLSNRFSKFIEK